MYAITSEIICVNINLKKECENLSTAIRKG